MKYFKTLWVASSLVFSLSAIADPGVKSDVKGPEVKEALGASSSSSSPAGPAGEELNVDAIKEKYWARGNETELGVVQNRTFSKKRKIEFSLLGGFLFSDPFLDIKTLGFSLGFHANEYVSFHLLAFKDLVGPSTALSTFETTSGATANTNKPQNYVGGEVMGSVFYGKLSVLGQSIIYYDLYLLGGLGRTSTESGNYLTPSAGIGQRFYLNQLMSIRVDYRLMHYEETILEKVITPKLGQSVGNRQNWSSSLIIGVSFTPFGI